MLKLTNIEFGYDNEKILSNFNLEVEDNQIMGLVGASGSGKSTILRIIAGLESQNNGHVSFNDEIIDDIPTHKRNIGYIFQSFALFPHLKVKENLEFGISKLPKDERKRKVNEISDLLRIQELLNRYPHELSGGQKQRVAIGRSLITEPKLMLLDEPFSALDKELRSILRQEIRDILKLKKIPAIIVTHDSDDVEAVCDISVKIK